VDAESHPDVPTMLRFRLTHRKVVLYPTPFHLPPSPALPTKWQAHNLDALAHRPPVVVTSPSVVGIPPQHKLEHPSPRPPDHPLPTEKLLFLPQIWPVEHKDQPRLEEYLCPIFCDEYVLGSLERMWTRRDEVNELVGKSWSRKVQCGVEYWTMRIHAGKRGILIAVVLLLRS